LARRGRPVALFRDPGDLAATTLAALGADYDDMRNRLIEKLAGFAKR
jgi:hypothetical protein